MIERLNSIIINGSNNKKILLDVTLKKDNLKKQVIIFSHGFKGFKDWGPFNQIASSFAENNFVFIKFNFSHNGTTLNDPNEFHDLKSFGNNICLLGHSRGGGITILKTNEDKRIKKIVSWASPSDFTNRLDKSKIEIWKEKGVIYVYNSRTKQNMPLYFQFYLDCKNNHDRIDIKKAVENIKIPHLVVHGEDDLTVLLKDAKDFKKWNDKTILHIIKDADHVFGSTHPFLDHSYPLHLNEAIEVTLKFLKL
jgi:predicted alpha/beta-hydrolase family hydrolase